MDETKAGATVGFRQGAGRLSLDFIRTLRHRGTPDAVEELPDARAAAAWITQFGPCPATGETGETTAATARRLREAVYELITAARGPDGIGSCPAGAREVVNEIASLPEPAPQLTPSGRLRWEAADPVAATLALVARDALDLVATPAITQVRDCANPECRAMFLDSSRPGTRRWCSMSTCGNRAKKAALQARSRSR